MLESVKALRQAHVCEVKLSLHPLSAVSSGLRIFAFYVWKKCELFNTLTVILW